MGGVLHPQRGTVSIGGLERRSSVQAETAIRKHAVYLPDRPWLPANATGREFLLCVGRLYGVEYERLFEHVDRLLALFDLTSQGDTPIRGYSSGQQKKISLCGALVSDAPVLMLDEPFSGGLDPAGLAALKHILRRRVRERHSTVVLTSPVPEIVEEVADRVLILRAGRIAAFDTMEGLRRQARTNGSLGSILETLLYPETMSKLEAYFAETP
jgi:ABC-type multidrug transport system ATPase subunit